MHTATQTAGSVRSVGRSPLFSSSPQMWLMGRGLGGWWLSLNDPVYFEKALISGSALLMANKGALKPILAQA